MNTQLIFPYNIEEEKYWKDSGGYEALFETLYDIEKEIFMNIDNVNFLRTNHDIVINAWKFYNKIMGVYNPKVFTRNYQCYLSKRGTLHLRRAASIFRTRAGLKDIYPENIYPEVEIKEWIDLEWLKYDNFINVEMWDLTKFQDKT